MRLKAGYVGNQRKNRYPLRNVSITNSKSEMFLFLELYDAVFRCLRGKSHSAWLFPGVCKNKKRKPLSLGMPIHLGIWPFVNSCKWFHSAYRHVHFYPRV